MPKSKIHSASILAEQNKQQQQIHSLLPKSESSRRLASLALTQSWCRPLNDSERCQIDDLRRILEPQLAKHSVQDVDNAYLLRWLRSKEGRFDEAADVRLNKTRCTVQCVLLAGHQERLGFPQSMGSRQDRQLDGTRGGNLLKIAPNNNNIASIAFCFQPLAAVTRF